MATKTKKLKSIAPLNIESTELSETAKNFEYNLGEGKKIKVSEMSEGQLKVIYKHIQNKISELQKRRNTLLNIEVIFEQVMDAKNIQKPEQIALKY